MLIISLCVALALAVAGCGGGDDDSSSTEATTAGKQGGETNLNAKPRVTVPDGPAPKKLEEKEIVAGDGAEAKAGDEVTVQYVGVGYDSGEEFDTSWGGAPFGFRLGAGEVIAGWDKGVAGMKVGGRRQLVIPANLAYGPSGYPPVIGPNEPLVFVIDLLAVS
jgi:peptidylprolyl isomerase